MGRLGYRIHWSLRRFWTYLLASFPGKTFCAGFRYPLCRNLYSCFAHCRCRSLNWHQKNYEWRSLYLSTASRMQKQATLRKISCCCIHITGTPDRFGTTSILPRIYANHAPLPAVCSMWCQPPLSSLILTLTSWISCRHCMRHIIRSLTYASAVPCLFSLVIHNFQCGDVAIRML